jgi:hypothetical protein
MDHDGAAIQALPLDDRTFLVDADDPDNPTMTLADSTPAAGPPCSMRCCGDCHA